MIGVSQSQRLRLVSERRTYLINQLYKLGIYKTRIGKNIEDVRLSDLEQIHINEKCRAANAQGSGAS